MTRADTATGACRLRANFELIDLRWFRGVLIARAFELATTEVVQSSVEQYTAAEGRRL